MDYSDWAPRDVRALISAGKLQGQTSGMCAGYAQANLCILPKAQAFDFLLFCMRNPRPHFRGGRGGLPPNGCHGPR